MRVTLLPEKHVRNSESLLGLGAVVLAFLYNEPKTLDKLWTGIKELDTIKPRVHGSVTLDSVVLAIDFLYSVGAVNLNSEGLLEHASH